LYLLRGVKCPQLRSAEGGNARNFALSYSRERIGECVKQQETGYRGKSFVRRDMMKGRKRDCLICGRHNWHGKTCFDDPQKRPIKTEVGFRPDWCPIDDNQFKKENWEKKSA